MSRRKKKNRKLKTTIFIVCEGKNTEPNYFQGIREDFESDTYSLEIEIHETATTHAIGLVKEAIEYIGEYNEVWVIFDKDGYTKHKETFELTEKNGVNIAFSSIAFEHWVLLHFEKNKNSFPKSADVIDYMDKNKLLPNYEKRKLYNLYPKIKNKTEFALENVAWLKKEMLFLKVLHKDIYKLNPYSNIDKLIRRLFEIPKEIIYHRAKQYIELDKFGFRLLEYQFNHNSLELEIELKNLDDKAFLALYDLRGFFITV